MTNEPIVLSAESTVAEALALIRRHELHPALAAPVFITLPPYETPTGRLLGTVHFQRMLRYPPHERRDAWWGPSPSTTFSTTCCRTTGVRSRRRAPRCPPFRPRPPRSPRGGDDGSRAQAEHPHQRPRCAPRALRCSRAHPAALP